MSDTGLSPQFPGAAVGGAAGAPRSVDRAARPWTPALVGLSGTLIAALGSWRPSLWTDESATISAASRSVAQLWRMVGQIDLVHGAYYLFMHVWISCFGISPFALRLPSAIAVGLATTCVFVLARRLRGEGFALLAAGLFAALPRVFWSGTEARSYAATAALAAAAALLLHIAVDTGRRRAWTGYALVLLLGILVNLFVGLLILAHLVAVFLDRTLTTADRRAFFVSAGLAGVASAPLVLTAATQSGQVGDHSFGILQLAQNVVVNQWFLGDTPTTTTGVGGHFSPGLPNSWWVPGSLTMAAVAWVVIAWAVRSEIRGSTAGTRFAGRPVLPYVLPVIVVPAAVIGVYSLVTTPLYSPRYLTFAAPAVAIALALGVVSIPRRAVRAAVVGVLIVSALPVYASQREIYGKNSSDWVSVAGYVRNHARAGDAVYFAPRYVVPGPTVGQTTRGILVAYPGDFAGLVDLTLQQSPASAGNLTGVSRRLADSTPQLASATAVWVIRRRDYPAAQATADAAVLADAGLRPASERWAGPLDEVLSYRRIS